MTDPSKPRAPQKLLDLLEKDRAAAAAALDRMARKERKTTRITATQAPSAYLNQSSRPLAEAVMERALRRIAARTNDPFARTQADTALAAIAELRNGGGK